MVKSHSPLAHNLMTAKEFFAFDIKDTFRLLVWIVVCAFTIGGFYFKQEATIISMDNKRSQLETRMDREFAHVHKTIDRLEALVVVSQANQASVLTSLEAVKTEIRYVNEKIDVLRTEIRKRE